MNRTTILAPLLALALATPALAGQVDRAQVTLGALVDHSDRVVLGRVESATDEHVTLAVLETVKGAAEGRLVLPRGGAATWRVGERALVALRLDEKGALVALGSPLEKIDVADDATATELVRAARARLPRLDGPDGEATATATRGELFRELDSNLARLREDAALELGAYRELAATGDERATLARALARGATPELLDLVRRVPAPALLEPTLVAARAATDDATRAAAARALVAIDRAATLETLGADLAGRDEKRAAQAARLLGGAGGEDATLLLVRALEDGRRSVRVATLETLAGSPDVRVAAKALERVLASGSSEDAELAAVALARGGVGDVLARAEANERLPESLRARVRELRSNPLAPKSAER